MINLFSGMTYGQSQWRFHVAFEDGTGQRDTVWMIYDSTATFGVDTSLGEGYTPLDHSRFNVWIYNPAFDTTKVSALPFLMFPSHGLSYIEAIGFTYPLIIRWDTSLFQSPLLPIDSSNQVFFNTAEIDNDYFWAINNDPSAHAYNMLITDSAFAPYFIFGSRSQFPMNIQLWHDPLNNIDKTSFSTCLFPNPGSENLTIRALSLISNIKIYNSMSVCVRTYNELHSTSVELHTPELPSGMYSICIIYESGESQLVKYIKL